MLFIVVFLAVVSGNLTTHYIELKLAARTADQALQKPNERTQQASARQKEQNLIRQRQSQVQRARSKTGVKLQRACQDWTQADKDNKTQTTAAGRTRHCKDYEVFIKTGKVP